MLCSPFFLLYYLLLTQYHYIDIVLVHVISFTQRKKEDAFLMCSLFLFNLVNPVQNPEATGASVFLRT